MNQYDLEDDESGNRWGMSVDNESGGFGIGGNLGGGGGGGYDFDLNGDGDAAEDGADDWVFDLGEIPGSEKKAKEKKKQV